MIPLGKAPKNRVLFPPSETWHREITPPQNGGDNGDSLCSRFASPAQSHPSAHSTSDVEVENQRLGHFHPCLSLRSPHISTHIRDFDILSSRVVCKPLLENWKKEKKTSASYNLCKDKTTPQIAPPQANPKEGQRKQGLATETTASWWNSNHQPEAAQRPLIGDLKHRVAPFVSKFRGKKEAKCHWFSH